MGYTDELGDRMKKFEMIEAGRLFIPGLPIIARLDGKSWHTFTRGLKRPYDERLSRLMIETTKYLIDENQADLGYTQSDEITLVFLPKNELIFGGRIHKLASILPSLAAAFFNAHLEREIPEKARKYPCLDCRVWQVPNIETVIEVLEWREMDATKNSITMAAGAFYSHKELHKKGSAEKHEMLHAKGVNWNDYPDFFKRGTYLKRITRERMLTAEELAKIPVAAREAVARDGHSEDDVLGGLI
jgi:tRNA(His) 5'-end guanylyltransferase